MQGSGADAHFELIAGTNKEPAIDAIANAMSRLQPHPAAESDFTETPMLLLRKNDDDSRKSIAKRVHDLRGALRTLGMAFDSIKNGYRFDDQMAAAKLNAMEKAFGVLERESQLPLRLLSHP